MKLIAALRWGAACPKLPSREVGAPRSRVPLRVMNAALAVVALSNSPALAQTAAGSAPKAEGATRKRAASSPDRVPSPPTAPSAQASSTGTPPAPPPFSPAGSTTPPAAAPTESDGSGPAAADTAAPTTPVPPVASAPSDATTPPPYPMAPPTEPPPAPATEDAIYEPPLPPRPAGGPGDAVDDDAVHDTAPPPPPIKHVAPRSSLWIGARPGVFVPLGAMWLDGEPVVDLCCVETVRPFSEFAGPGPSLGLDLGVRFARHYQAFAFWERAWLSAGSLEDDFGGQSSASTSMFGGGFRFSTHPDSIGLLVEISLGYRTFEAEWESGTRLTAADDLFSTRLGFGVEWRINPLTTLELLLVVGGGAFTDVEWAFADGTKRSALTGYDRYGQYIPFSLQLASHWDVISSDD